MSGGAAARIRRLFEEATDLPVGERAAFLDRACGDDLETRREVEALLTLVPDTDELPIRPIVDALLHSDGPEPSAAFDCIDEYRLERPLGAGGMGVVYEAFDETLRRKVALKIYAGAALASGDVRERMRREARAAAAINHPNVVTVFAVGEHEGCPYLVMELAGGRTLRDVLREGPLPLPRALQIARELAAGLGAIHRAGIVHRDLKPENVSIGEDGRTRILDFGIAASTLDVRDRDPREGRRRSGTTPYMSPEQTSGREPDVRSDIFTLGGLFYELVTGKRPFDRETPEETRRAISRDEPNPPRALSPALPDRMERIILRCLAKSPGARYPDAGALLTDLERVEMVADPERSNRPETLPAYSTRFFGRADERVRLADSLSERRLVTVVGLGGAGKTRFAVEVAAEVADRFADGVRFVSLGEISDPALVTQAFLASVRAREHGRVNHLETLVTALADRELLLLVDNCEHLVPAVRETVAALLARCPGVTVLTTSRERLSIDGEALFPIAPLAAPAAESAYELARSNPLVRLFVDRASSVDREFSLSLENEEHVFEICRRTDGLPLAAELAAAHARMMTPAEILGRMKQRLALLRKSGADPADRHRSMRSMIDWSVSQLDEPERAVLRRLTVFRGGWTLEAAEDVCAFESVSREDVLEHLATLLDKSLVERRVDRADESSGSRYHMLETVREYASEMVGAEERRSALENHVAHFEKLCGGVSWIGPEQALWLARLGREEPNIRAIFDRAGELDLDAKRLSFFVSKHAGFWVRTGRWREGRRRCAETLGALERQGQASGYHYAFVMGRDGELAQCQGRLDEASRILADTLARAVEMSDDQLMSSVNSTMGTVELFRGDLDAARKHYTDSLEYASRGEVTSERDRLHQAWNHAGTLLNRGTTFAQQGRYEEAREDFAESLRIKRELHDTRGIAQALNGLGVLAGKLGRFEEAHELLEESLELKRALGDHLGSVNTLHNLAGMASDRFETLADDSALLDYADRCIDEALAVARKLGARPSIVDLVTMRGGVALLREAYAEARTCLEEALASARELNSPLAEAMARMQLAALGVATGDPDTAWEELRAVAPVFHEAHVPWLGQMLEIASEAAVGRGEDESAARLLGASDAIAESHGAVTPPWRRTRTEQLRDALCTRLGEVRLRMLEAAGRETAIRDTLAEVLGAPE